MDKYINVNVDKSANIYFEDGSKKTLGVMLPGKYVFNTQVKEKMEIISGKLSLKLPNYNDWKLIEAGMNFNIPKNSSFKVDVLELVNYICSYYD